MWVWARKKPVPVTGGGDTAKMAQSRVSEPKQEQEGIQEVGQKGNLMQVSDFKWGKKDIHTEIY